MAGERHFKVRVPKRHRGVGLDPDTEDFLKRTEDAVALLAGVEVEIPGPTPPNPGIATILVPHRLGLVPDRVAMVDTGDLGGTLYATDALKAQWTDSHVVLFATLPGDTNLTIRLTRRPE